MSKMNRPGMCGTKPMKKSKTNPMLELPKGAKLLLNGKPTKPTAKLKSGDVLTIEWPTPFGTEHINFKHRKENIFLSCCINL